LKSKKSKSKSPFFEIEKLIKDIDKQLRETGEYKEKNTLKKKL
jgi:RecJ-like exonuclease